MDISIRITSLDGVKHEPKIIQECLKLEETQWKHFTCSLPYIKHLLNMYSLLIQDGRLRNVDIQYMGFDITPLHQDTLLPDGNAKIVLSHDYVSIFFGSDFNRKFYRHELEQVIGVLELLEREPRK